eukprot:TRINITY_DN14508_c0_g1_i6.p2 TRINITY_DN14508_c0_g1~~TRINITY_DN14508_c0_g1_i6.p2  ORF type:complete len:256 (-),score=45.36 TRINITY_DN14508_c0_g1_i6:64-831(-)
MCRPCANIPKSLYNNTKKFFDGFDDTTDYWHSVFISLGKNKDRILGNLLKIQEAFEAENHYQTGYFIGDLAIVIFNVTKIKPKPTGNYQFIVPALPTMDWDALHDRFVRWFGYAMTVLNYTKWVDAVHVNELKDSVLASELLLYQGIRCVQANQTLEGILKAIDTLKHANRVFRSSYFTTVQVAEKAPKNSVMQHSEFFQDNLELHAGYFFWNGYKAINGILDEDWDEVLRRLTVIARKVFYFDEFALEDIETAT